MGRKAFHFDGRPRLTCDGVPMHQLMYLGGFAEYCVVPAQSAVRVPAAMPFDRAALLGCGVMTGVGAATRIADLRWGAAAMVIGCGAVGLSAVQGCRLAGAGTIIAVDPNPARRQLAQALGATQACGGDPDEAVALARSLTDGRGADVVIEAAGRREQLPPVRGGGAARRAGGLARQDGGERRRGVPLGQPDAGEADHPQFLWRGEAGAGFSAAGAGVSGRQR